MSTDCCDTTKTAEGGEKWKEWIEERERAFQQMNEARKRYTEVLNSRPAEKVEDYELKLLDGTVRLSELFGDHDELLVVHNMGASCPYCTLWADGFNGFVEHLRDRTAFVVASPDTPESQRRFAKKRGWEFSMVSTKDSDFSVDMGFEDRDEGVVRPGVSAFQRTPSGEIERIAADRFGPGDLYCSLWHLIDLLDGDAYDWGPKLKYG